jgi:hypothetical protein
LPAPIDFPHDDPDPCAGYSLTESFIVLIFWIESNNNPAKS